MHHLAPHEHSHGLAVALQLRHQGEVVDGIWFGRTEPLDAWEHLAFRLDINEWKGERKVQFLVEGALQS